MRPLYALAPVTVAETATCHQGHCLQPRASKRWPQPFPALKPSSGNKCYRDRPCSEPQAISRTSTTGQVMLAGPSHTCLSQQLHPWPTSVPLFANFCLCPAGTEPVPDGLQPRSMQADQHDSSECGPVQLMHTLAATQLLRSPYQEAVHKNGCCWRTILTACFCCNIDLFVC